MLTRMVAVVLLLSTALVAGAAPDGPVGSAQAMCYLDPNDLVGSVQCGMVDLVECVKKKFNCPV